MLEVTKHAASIHADFWSTQALLPTNGGCKGLLRPEAECYCLLALDTYCNRDQSSDKSTQVNPSHEGKTAHIEAGAVVAGAGEVEGGAAGADVAAKRGTPVAAEAALYHAPPPHSHTHFLQLPLMRLVHLPSHTHTVFGARLQDHLCRFVGPCCLKCVHGLVTGLSCSPRHTAPTHNAAGQSLTPDGEHSLALASVQVEHRLICARCK